MLSAVQGADGRMIGVLRTYLCERDGEVVKASVDKPKKALGRISGGAVRLATAGPELVLCEGVESGLSYMQATGRPTWVSLGTSNLSAIELPIEVTNITIACDSDAAGRAAAHKAAEVYLRQGRRVRLAVPPAGFGDFNDVLIGKPETTSPVS
jgi:hypothetical protein